MLPWYPDTYGEHCEYAGEMAEVFKQVRRQPRSTWMDWYGWALPVSVNPAYRKDVQPLIDRWKNQTFAEFITKAGRLEFPLGEVFDVRVANHAIMRLEALNSKPFFITASLNYPHDPNVVPSPYYEMFSPGAIELPATFDHREARFESDWSRTIVAAVGESGLRELLRIYYASVCLMDAQVGRILDSLERTGRTKDTIVVFTTDHGDMAGGHGMFWKSTQAFYEDVVRVPLIISYPRRIKPGMNSMAVSSADLLPTLLELTDRKCPEEAEGYSLASGLLEKRTMAPQRRYAFCERITPNRGHTRQFLPGMRGSFMVRGDEWKYIRYADGGEYLYNLMEDPGEIRNLADVAKYRDKRNHLSEEIQKWLRETHSPRFAEMST